MLPPPVPLPLLLTGSFLQCQAVAGVGLAYQWTMFLSGFPGYASPPSAVTNYLPPVLYDIFSEFNNTLTSPSAGNEVFNITGDNFGPAAANVLWWVHYTPVDHPAIIFNAHCQV